MCIGSAVQYLHIKILLRDPRRRPRSEGRGRGEELQIILSIFSVLSGSARVLLEELLGLVDLGGEVGAAAAVGVVQQHQGAVGLADLLLGEGALAVSRS